MRLAMRKRILAALAVLITCCSSPAFAEIMMGFHNYQLKVGMNVNFPHAFVSMKGTKSDGTPVDENIGFTAHSITPAVLTGWVKGQMDNLKPAYVDASDRQFEIKISDAQYAEIKAFAEKWNTYPGKSYNLNKRNCIHFVAALGTLLGLKSDIGPDYVKKPEAFLRKMLELNPSLVSLRPLKAKAKASGK
jgi:hypothetical protein